MEIYRTKFKGEIISEFAMPNKKSDKVIILCHGMPGVPKQKEQMLFFAKKGYWVFSPRYRGSWESGGEFLKESPYKDIEDIIEELPKGFKELWYGKTYKIQPKKLFILGGSFGGPAAIFATRDPRVTKAVAVCPVIDWQAPSKDEPMDRLGAFIQEAFTNGYRFTPENWERLSRGEFYNPIDEAKTIVGEKLLLIHTKDDTSVPYSVTKKFATKTGSKLIILPKGGHHGTNLILSRKSLWKKVSAFLK